jgi:hypothetical protein
MTLQKTESFLPLTTVAPVDKNREFRVTVVSQSEPAKVFKGLGQNAAGTADASSGQAKNVCEPRLTMERDGERISSIRILCSCGQIMELACVYDEPAKTK